MTQSSGDTGAEPNFASKERFLELANFTKAFGNKTLIPVDERFLKTVQGKFSH